MIARIVAAVALVLVLAGCVPVMDPARWDPTVYCRTVRPPDPSCKVRP